MNIWPGEVIQLRVSKNKKLSGSGPETSRGANLAWLDHALDKQNHTCYFNLKGF